MVFALRFPFILWICTVINQILYSYMTYI